MAGDPTRSAPSPGSAPAAPAQRSAFARLRRALLVSSVTLVVLLLGAELFLRATGNRRHTFEAGIQKTLPRWAALMQGGVFEGVDDDVRRYAMRPGGDTTVDGWRFRVSAYRTRGPDFPREKPANERRLLCLGDSFAFGLWCDEDRTLVGHLARMANEVEAARGSGITWRPINLGVPGYHSGQQMRSFELDGLALDPDVVVLYYNSNDINREGFFFEPKYRALRADHLPLPVGLRRALWHSHLYGWIVSKLNRYWGSLASGLDPRCPWSPLREDNREYTRAALERIVHLCRENDIGLFVVNQPLMTWSGDARNPSWPQLEVFRWAQGVFADLGVESIDMLGWLRGYADGVDRLLPDGSGPPQDFFPEMYFADARFEPLKRRFLAGEPIDESEITSIVEPDYHLLGEGYEHFARLCFPRMQAAGLLPR